MTDERQKRRDDQLAHDLLMLCWRIKAKTQGDTGKMHQEPNR